MYYSSKPPFLLTNPTDPLSPLFIWSKTNELFSDCYFNYSAVVPASHSSCAYRLVWFEEYPSSMYPSTKTRFGSHALYSQHPAGSHPKTRTNPERSQRVDRLKALAKLSAKPLPRVVSALVHNRVPPGPRQSTGQKTLRKMTASRSYPRKRVFR